MLQLLLSFFFLFFEPFYHSFRTIHLLPFPCRKEVDEGHFSFPINEQLATSTAVTGDKIWQFPKICYLCELEHFLAVFCSSCLMTRAKKEQSIFWPVSAADLLTTLPTFYAIAWNCKRGSSSPRNVLEYYINQLPWTFMKLLWKGVLIPAPASRWPWLLQTSFPSASPCLLYTRSRSVC